MARLFVSIRDWSDEYGQMNLRLQEPADLTTVGDFDDTQAALLASIGGVSLGNIAKAYSVVREEGNDSRPASALAQREFGLRVFYEDVVTGDKGNFTVPAVDIAVLTIEGGGDKVTLQDAGPMAALVTDVENLVRSKAGNAITVTGAFIVGRNS